MDMKIFTFNYVGEITKCVKKRVDRIGWLAMVHQIGEIYA